MPRNFGDWVGPYLYLKMTGRPAVFYSSRAQKMSNGVFSAGSILRRLKSNDRVSVWGSGIISTKDVVARPRQILAVRGPRTRNHLLKCGYDCPEIFGDPAILLPKFLTFDEAPKAGGVGVVPHFVETDRYQASEIGGVNVIDVRRPVEMVCAEIADKELIFSSSLHGIIVAHAFGVPAVWMAPSIEIDGDDTKFHDYFESCGVDAVRVGSLLKNVDLLVHAPSHATLPDHTALIGPLWNSCPWNK